MTASRTLLTGGIVVSISWLLAAGCPPTALVPDELDGADSESAHGAPPPDGEPQGALPPAPTLSSTPEPVRGTTVELRWNAVPRVTYYSVYAGTSEDPPFIMNVAQPSYTLRGLFGCRTYYWRIEAHNANGPRSSEIASFRTACAADAPVPPRYPAPSNKAFGVSPDVTLSWGPSARASTYEVYFGETSNPPYVGSTSESRFTRVLNVGEGREYYWRVEALNDDGRTTSHTWRFSVTETPDGPPTPVPLSPPDGALDVPTRVRLDWADSQGAIAYDVYVDTVANPQALYARVTESELAVIDGLTLATTYYWRVVAVGSEAPTAGPVWSFSTVATPIPPLSPSGPVPADAAVNINPTVQLRWAHDPSATSYEVYLGTDANPQLVATVSEPSCQPVEPLPRGSTHFWRVVAVNEVGATAGPLWRFTIASGGGGGGAISVSGCNGFIERVSISSSGTQGNGSAMHPAISGDGRFVAFVSIASNLVDGDTNGSMDIFVHDRTTGLTTRVSVDSTGGQAHGQCEYPSISADGRYVAFHTTAALVTTDTNSFEDVYVHDRATAETGLVSVGGNGCSKGPAISGNGRCVAFYSRASNLVPGDTNDAADIFVRDRELGVFERVHVASNGSEANRGAFGDASVSYDGRHVAFSSTATNLGGFGQIVNVFVRDRNAGQTEPIGVGITPSLSSDAQFVAWMMIGTGAGSQVWVLDRSSGTYTMASVSSDGVAGDGTSWLASLSGNGHSIAFASIATNLVPGDVNGEMDIFRHDLLSGETALLSIGVGNVLANGSSASPDISDDGAVITFLSGATNLVEGDTNGASDVFVIECEP